jgi:hypothetical protein
MARPYFHDNARRNLLPKMASRPTHTALRNALLNRIAFLDQLETRSHFLPLPLEIFDFIVGDSIGQRIKRTTVISIPSLCRAGLGADLP